MAHVSHMGKGDVFQVKVPQANCIGAKMSERKSGIQRLTWPEEGDTTKSSSGSQYGTLARFASVLLSKM